MKQIIFTLFALMTFVNGHSQVKVLTKPEVEQLFPEGVQQQLGLKYPIRIVYKYWDKTGTYYMPLCEEFDGVKEEDSTHWKIKAQNLRYEDGQFVRQWELNDYILTAQMEEDIWFFTKYTNLKDLDGDGVVDPVMVYGSAGANGRSDGRLKILVYYKGKKVAVRHQNSEFDGGRTTEVDKEFYELPEKVQGFVRGLMKRLEEEDKAIFASEWMEKMARKLTYIQ